MEWSGGAGPRAGENPPAAASRARGAEAGRPAGRLEKANPYLYHMDKEKHTERSFIIIIMLVY
jgi:hypothetical protein